MAKYFRRGHAAIGGANHHLQQLVAGLIYNPIADEMFTAERGKGAFLNDRRRLRVAARRTLADAGLSTYTAKNHYQRKRPFMVNNAPICTPEEEAQLRKDGSYPSGHTAIDWAWALVLTEIAPDRADAILARGRAGRFGCRPFDQVPCPRPD